MKKYFLIILITSILFSCSDDDKKVFNVDLKDLSVSFEPYEGGAYMNYTLPANTDIYGIQAMYKDAQGNNITVKGTHTSERLDLFGFNTAGEDIPVKISLIDLDGNLSETLDKTFSTLNSAAVSIFDNLTVTSHWNGFRVDYPKFAGRHDGVINIYYIGINPENNREEPLPIVSMPFFADGYSFKYSGIEDISVDDLTIVVRTEDGRGKTVKEQIYEKVPIAHAEKFPSKDIVFEGNSEESDINKTGWKYLFDGDVRGEQQLLNGDHKKLYSYISEEGAEFDERNVLTLDLQKEKEISEVRIYSHLSARMPIDRKMRTVKEQHKFMYPNSVTIYGTNDKDASKEEWVELNSFYQHPELLWSEKTCWIYPAFDEENFYTVSEVELLRMADPNYIYLTCDVTGNSYRYIKLVINETFYLKSSTFEQGTNGQFAMEEVEIFVKSE